jgi:hypothetical protein
VLLLLLKGLVSVKKLILSRNLDFSKLLIRVHTNLLARFQLNMVFLKEQLVISYINIKFKDLLLIKEAESSYSALVNS